MSNSDVAGRSFAGRKSQFISEINVYSTNTCPLHEGRAPWNQSTLSGQGWTLLWAHWVLSDQISFDENSMSINSHIVHSCCHILLILFEQSLGGKKTVIQGSLLAHLLLKIL